MSVELRAASKLTVFVGGDERHEHRPLYEAVLDALRAGGIAGATVTRGMLSYGQGRRIRNDLNETTMENLPLIVEAVDEGEKIERVAAHVAALLGAHGLVEVRRTAVVAAVSAEEERNAG
jgi:uncharacterized protein